MGLMYEIDIIHEILSLYRHRMYEILAKGAKGLGG
jgi:hypothetical protein